MIGHDVRLLVIAALMAYSPLILIWSLCIFGVAWTIAGVELFISVPMVGLLVALAAMFAVPFRRSRQIAIRAIVVGGGLALLFIPAVFVAGKLRMLGF